MPVKLSEIGVPDAVRRKAGLRPGERVEFRASRRVIKIVPVEPEKDYSTSEVVKILTDAQKRPIDPKKGKTADKRLMEYGAAQVRKLGLKEADIPRIVHESRARRRTS